MHAYVEFYSSFQLVEHPRSSPTFIGILAEEDSPGEKTHFKARPRKNVSYHSIVVQEPDQMMAATHGATSDGYSINSSHLL